MFAGFDGQQTKATSRIVQSPMINGWVSRKLAHFYSFYTNSLILFYIYTRSQNESALFLSCWDLMERSLFPSQEKLFAILGTFLNSVDHSCGLFEASCIHVDPLLDPPHSLHGVLWTYGNPLRPSYDPHGLWMLPYTITNPCLTLVSFFVVCLQHKKVKVYWVNNLQINNGKKKDSFVFKKSK